MKYKDLIDIPQETICLSLEECTERRSLFEKRWKDQNLKSFRYHIAKRPTEEYLSHRFSNFCGVEINEKFSNTHLGRWGCWLSHYDILLNAKNRGVKSVLLLEDDSYLNLELLDKEINQVPYDWDVIYLGNSSCDVLAEYKDLPVITEYTFRDSSSRHNLGGWKKVRSWGTFAMIIRNTVFDHFINELKDYVFPGRSNFNPPTADGTYYFYLWKKLSFYFMDHLVLHDYSLKSEITCKQAKREDYIAFRG